MDASLEIDVDHALRQTQIHTNQVADDKVLERRVSAKRREIARLRADMRMHEARMQQLIADDKDCSIVAGELLLMRRQLAQLIVMRDALILALMTRSDIKCAAT